MRKLPTIVLPAVYAAGQLKQDFSGVALDGAILGLWKLGKDTRAMAWSLNMRESAVANRLAWLRDNTVRV